MITVNILINGKALIARSAVNQLKTDKDGFDTYKTDCGQIIKHKRKDGPVILAKKMLDLVKEMK